MREELCKCRSIGINPEAAEDCVAMLDKLIVTLAKGRIRAIEAGWPDDPGSPSSIILDEARAVFAKAKLP